MRQQKVKKRNHFKRFKINLDKLKSKLYKDNPYKNRKEDNNRKINGLKNQTLKRL